MDPERSGTSAEAEAMVLVVVRGCIDVVRTPSPMVGARAVWELLDLGWVRKKEIQRRGLVLEMRRSRLQASSLGTQVDYADMSKGPATAVRMMGGPVMRATWECV